MFKMTLSLKSCDRVCDRLHLGDKNAACDLDLLARLKVKLKSVRNFLVPSAPQGKVNFRVQHTYCTKTFLFPWKHRRHGRSSADYSLEIFGGSRVLNFLKVRKSTFPLSYSLRVLVARRSFLKVWHFSEPPIPIPPARPRT